MRLHLLAIGLAVKKRTFVVFFRAAHVIPNAQLSADTIEVPNTDLDAELLLQGCLYLPAWYLWICATGCSQPLEYSFSQFGWMSMPSILEYSISSCLYRMQQTIRG